MRGIVAGRGLWIATVLALLGTAGRAAAQAEMVTTCVARGAGMPLFRMPASDTAAFQDSLRRAEPLPRAGYAGEQPWFNSFERVNFPSHYRPGLGKHSRPRFIDGHLLRRVGEYQGVGVYAATDVWWRVEVLYIPVRAGCEFQPYRTAHWGLPCSVVGCPFAEREPPRGAVCRLRGDGLVWEDARRREPTSGFAESRRWYVTGRPITFRRREYLKTGLTHTLPPGSVHRIGEVDGVGVYVGIAEKGLERPWGFYVPVRAGCEFQLYEDAMEFGGVRGE